MDKYSREHSIKSIINLEDRIVHCGRCPALVNCTYKPSLGRGDLQPQVVLVFECESACTRNMEWIIKLRNSIKQYFEVERVYHTYLVRCQPKSCASLRGLDCSLPSRLLDRSNICVLTNQLCAGIPIQPANEEILNCLTFLLEEIIVLQPACVVLFGSRVSDFVLRSLGSFAPDDDIPAYRYENTIFLPTAAGEAIQDTEIRRLAALVKGQ